MKARLTSYPAALAYKLLCSGHSGTKAKRVRKKEIMKKSNILIAAFAVIAAASVARAGNPEVDFDGRTSGALSFTETLRENMAVAGDITMPQAAPVAEFAGAISPLSSGGCMAVCQYGMNSDCSCKKSWLQEFLEQQSGTTCQPVPLDTGWYEMVRCGGNPVDWNLLISGSQGQAKSVASARMFHPDLQQKLRDILMGYCNTYPEFAEAVLPMLKDEKAKIVARDGFVYILSGNSIIRFDGKATTGPETNASSRKSWLPGWAGPAADAVGAAYAATQAWNEYHSYPPIPDSGTADDYHGPALNINDHHDDPFWTPKE